MDRDWRGGAAAVMSSILAVLQWLVGNPFEADGRALLLVVVMMLSDFALGTTVAVIKRRWRFTRLRQGVGKLLLWGAMLVVARQLSRPIGVLGADPLLRFVADYLLLYLILVDLVSVLRHIAALARVAGVSVLGLERLIGWVEAWHDQATPESLAPGTSGARKKPKKEDPTP